MVDRTGVADAEDRSRRVDITLNGSFACPPHAIGVCGRDAKRQTGNSGRRLPFLKGRLSTASLPLPSLAIEPEPPRKRKPVGAPKPVEDDARTSVPAKRTRR